MPGAGPALHRAVPKPVKIPKLPKRPAFAVPALTPPKLPAFGKHAPEPPQALPLPPPAPPEPLATGTLMQKPRLGRGVISLLSLLLAVSVFAVVITIALSRLVSTSAADRDLAIQVAAARQSTAAAGSSALGGQVKLLATGGPAAGVAVDIFTASALGSPLVSTATDAAGHWNAANLQDGAYKIRFSAAGFSQIWYPSATDATGATAVNLQVGQKMGGLGVALGGLPATVAGAIVGDDVAGAVLTVSVPQADLPRSGAPPPPVPSTSVMTTVTGGPATTIGPAPTPNASSSGGPAAGAHAPVADTGAAATAAAAHAPVADTGAAATAGAAHGTGGASPGRCRAPSCKPCPSGRTAPSRSTNFPRPPSTT